MAPPGDKTLLSNIGSPGGKIDGTDILVSVEPLFHAEDTNVVMDSFVVFVVVPRVHGELVNFTNLFGA